MIQHFTKGEKIILQYEGHETTAVIEICSDNGLSIAVMFEDYLAGYLGAMPIYYDMENKRYADLLHSKEVILKKINGEADKV